MNPVDPSGETPLVIFERALAAFDGAPEDFDFMGARTMLTIVAAASGADTIISPDGLTVSWPRCRDPYRYVPKLGAAVISALRASSPGGSLGAAFDLDPDTLAKLCFSRHAAPMRFWVTRSTDQIAVICRVATADPPALSTPDPLPPWSPPSAVFAVYPAGRACAHCRVSALRFQRLPGSVLVCLQCGRPQQVRAQELERATMESEVPSVKSHAT